MGDTAVLNDKFKMLARDVASCVLVNAGAFSARIPGNRKHPSFVNGEFMIDIFDGGDHVGQIVVRDLRTVPKVGVEYPL